jgi:ubiquinol-cytochrome c reductase cytochrome b subunit
MFGSILILFALPWLDTSKVRSMRYRPIARQFFILFVIACLLLGYLGAQLPEGIYVILARLATVYYFAYFLIILPLLGLIETPKPRPASIDAAVLGKGAAQPAE